MVRRWSLGCGWSPVVGPGIGSGSSRGCCRPSITTRPSCGGRRRWSCWAACRCPACGRSTRRGGSRPSWTTSADGWSTATPRAPWRWSRGCSEPPPPCPTGLCATNWTGRPRAASPMGCTGPGWPGAVHSRLCRPHAEGDYGMTETLDLASELLGLLAETDTEPRCNAQLEALTLAVAADLPVLLWGEPGIGKTAALGQLADSLGLPLTTVIASVHEPTDFAGLPVVGADPAAHGVPLAPPDWAVRLARAGRGLLFLDELSTAPPAVQAALLRLVLERRVGALRLPPGVRIVAAANPRASAADGWELSAPLANRFVHLDWTYDHDVVVRGLGGTWPRASLPRLDRAALPDAVDYARRAVCGLLAARPALVHQLPKTETRRGGAWP